MRQRYTFESNNSKLRNRKTKHVSVQYAILVLVLLISSFQLRAQGTWTTITNLSPDDNQGVMFLMSDGTVLCKSGAGGGSGFVWNKLTPNSFGSYSAGTWSTIASMNDDRRFFSTQILKDGRLYVCGGEYGTGGTTSEIYNPVSNTWTLAAAPGGFVSDANSEILDDGRVLQALVGTGQHQCKLYNASTNTYSAAGSTIGSHNESTWLKLPDGSILMVPKQSTNSERYIPATNTWIADGTVPVVLYDAWGAETGGAALLPNGQAFFVGATGHTAYYTPSGTTSPGTWTAGPDIPGGYGQSDAPVSIMPDGKILLTCSPAPNGAGSANIFRTPTKFYEFNYLTNTYTAVTAPGGGASLPITCYTTNLLNLPNGQIMYGQMGSTQYYVYTPAGSPSNSWKPTITGVNSSCSTYKLYGTKFNGISQGTIYGDDWQMNTNYPIVKLNGGFLNLFNTYAKTTNWNTYGVQRGSSPDTVDFDLPAGFANGTYNLSVSANGISSNSISFNTYPSLTSALSTTVCSGSSLAYNESYDRNCVSVSWTRAAVAGISNAAVTSPSGGFPNEVLINTTSSPINVTYVITLSNNGYSNTQNFVVTVNPKPFVYTSPSSICAGVTTSVTGNGASTYLWLPTGFTGGVYTLTPNSTATYTVIGTNTYGCTDTTKLYINQAPTVSASSSIATICSGNYSTISSSASNIETDSLLTTLAAGNGFSGNVFDVYAYKPLTIKNVKMQMSAGTTQAEVWYKSGSYGNANLTSSVGWTKLGATVNVTSAGVGALTTIPLTATLSIPAGNYYGIAVVCNGSNYYTNGSSVGSTAAYNNDIWISQGHGGGGMGGAFNFTNSPRIFNGEITYDVTNAISSYAWTPAASLTTPNSQSSLASPSTSTVYTVVATDINGCTAEATTNVGVYPNPPLGTATVSPTQICLGQSTTLNYTSPSALTCTGGFQNGFANLFAPANWSTIQTNSNGTVNASTAPDSITLVSSNGLSGPGTTDYRIVVPCDGFITFDWNYTTVDGSFYDRPRFKVNGNAFVEFPGYQIFGAASQNGSMSVLVNAGDTLNLQAYSADNFAGPCTIRIKNFIAPTKTIPSQYIYWYDAPISGNYLGSTTSLTYTPTTSGTKKYYAEVIDLVTGCYNSTRAATNDIFVNALPSISTSVSPSTICQGDSAQFTTISSSFENDSLFTTLASNNSFSGNVFDITTTKSIVITDFKMNMDLTSTQAEVWYKFGGFGGVALNSNVGWTKLGATVPITSSGDGTLTTIPTTVNLSIAAGQTVGIAVVCNGTANYTNGTVVGNIYKSNGDLAIKEGYGGAGFGGAFNFNNAPRVWNGEIMYTVNNTITGYSWSPTSGLNNSTISNPKGSPTSSTIYAVTSTDGNGCTNSSYANLYVKPSPTLGTATASPSSACLGSTLSLAYSAPAGLLCNGAYQTGFAGTYAPINWSTTQTNSNGTVNIGSAPASISMISSNGLSGVGYTNYSITIPCTGIVSFNWNYTTTDGSQYDYPRYSTNGGITYSLFPGYSTSGGPTQSGIFNLILNAGQTLTLQSYSVDNVGGTCNTTISNFKAPYQTLANQSIVWFSAPTGGSNLGNGNPQLLTPAVAGTFTYYAQVTDISASCTNTTRAATNTVVINPIPNINASATQSTICEGANTTLNATGGTSYTWQPGGLTGSSVVVTPTTTTTYTVTGTGTGGCTKTATILITVNPLPVIAGSATPGIVCPGGAVTLTGTTPGVTWSWNPGGLTGSPVIVNPTSQTTYTVTATSAAGCSKTQTFVILMNPVPTVGTTVSPSAVFCAGGSATITANGASTYSWQPGGAIGANLIVTLANTYTVTGTNAQGCTATATRVITVNALPTVGITATLTTLCQGNSTTLNGTGALTYIWNPGALTGTSINVNPATTTTYTVTGTNANGCTNTSLITINVNALPSISVTPTSTTICAGSPTTLTASATAGSLYSWNPGGFNTPAITVSPITTTIYTVTATNPATGCAASTFATVNVNALPPVNTTVTNATICAGSSTSITGTGANTYTWNPGALSGTTITVSPIATTTYTVTGTNTATGCTATSTRLITVNSLPSVGTSVTNATICVGSSTAITGTGANTYTWNPGALTGTTINVSPIATTTYTVTGTNTTTGCTATATRLITVNSAPTVGTTVTNATICAGSSTSITGTGAITYAWNPGALSGTTINVSPAITTTYTVTGTNANGCTATSTRLITVNSLPSVGTTVTNATICAGSSTAITGTGANTYTWNPGALSGTTINVSPIATTTYTVTGTNTATGCTATSTRLITVNSLPSVGTTVTNATICAGSSTAITGTGANTYTWNPGALSGTTINVSPIATTTYTVTGTNTTTGCTATATRLITVNSAPTVGTTVTNATICAGSSTSITGTGAVTYTWNPGALSGTTINVSPAATTTYTVTGTNANGCTATATRLITVTSCGGSTVNLKLFIEGYYLGGGLMDQVMVNEGIAGATSTQTDTIIVQLRNTTFPFSAAASIKTILNTNGTAVCNFPISGTYYIAVLHRNAVPTWSANPVTVSASPITYDFSNLITKAYGNNMQTVGAGVFAFYSGDLNYDENVDLGDLGILESDITNFASGYLPTDINGDGNVDILDATIEENNVNSFIFSAHP